MYHFRKKHLVYLRKKASDVGCPFCKPETVPGLVKETEHAYIVSNRTFYDVWEMHDVEDHLLIIPRRHVTGLHELSAAERTEIMDIMADYEGKGYNVYARTAGNVRKSVAHQHTHLIKITGDRARFYLATKKPYLVIKF